MKLVTTSKAAEQLRIHPTTLRRWLKAGKVAPAYVTSGGHARWDLDQLAEQTGSNTKMSLEDELASANINHDELRTLLASTFSLGEWQGDGKAVYRAKSGEIAVALTFAKGLLDAEVGPGLSDETRGQLRDDIAGLTRSHTTVVWREVFFNILPVDGYWRYRDEWQIVPAPPQAPRPDVVIADHPFVVELRVPSYPGRRMLDATIRERRAWELQLIFNLVLRGGAKRFNRRGPEHMWAYIPDPDGGSKVDWVQPGYFIPNWIYQSLDFTSVDGLNPLPAVPERLCRTRMRSGISSDDAFEISAVLEPVLDASRSVSPETRDRFLRACYWYERSRAAWNLSVSLGFIAAVNAIETMVPGGTEDTCPECGLNRAPGITRRFRDFVERYAPLVSAGDRKKIYKLRSSLVHGDHLFDIDQPSPSPFGMVVPRHMKQLDTYGATRIVARDAIINWLLDHRFS